MLTNANNANNANKDVADSILQSSNRSQNQKHGHSQLWPLSWVSQAWQQYWYFVCVSVTSASQPVVPLRRNSC